MTNPAELLGGGPWWIEGSRTAVGKQTELLKLSPPKITITPSINAPLEGS